MSKRTDSNGYTIIFSVIMVIVVGALLAFFANFTKADRIKNDQVKAQIDILNAIGIEADRSNATEMFAKYIKEQKVIEGEKVSDDDKAYLIDVKKELDNAKNGLTQKLPLFIAEKDGKPVYILPVRGNGLWDAIWGYIALNEDLKSVNGVYFDHKGETPGLGANITETFFTDDFKGESLYGGTGNFKGRNSLY